MIKLRKQVRNHFLLGVGFIALSAVVVPAHAEIQNPAGGGNIAGDKVFSVGEMFDGITKSVSDLVTGSSTDSSKTADKKGAEPKMIKAKRLDQTTKDTATGADAKKQSAAPPAPYKVYNTPIVADEPVVPRPRVDPVASRSYTPAPSTMKEPPPLSDDIKNHLEDIIVDPPMNGKFSRATPQQPKTRPTIDPRRGGEVAPASALPKQFFPVFPLGGDKDTPGQLLPISSNIELETQHSGITRAILFIHDMQRNSADGVATLMTLSGESSRDTLILAPQFSLDLDIMRFAAFLPENGRNVTRWTLDDSWQFGGESRTSPQQKGISSFTAMDILLLFLTDRARFPMLTQVVIAGHGMGADFVQRYAALGQAPDILAKEKIATRFVVANPSSFMYMTNIRPTDTGARFANPDLKSCPKLNDYPYGDLNLPAYGKKTGPNAVRLRYPERNVVYLTSDAIASDNYLDRGCEATVQGRDRAARGKLFGKYMAQSFGESAEAKHFFAVVPKTGYDPVAVFGSPCGMEALFGYGRCKSSNTVNDR